MALSETPLLLPAGMGFRRPSSHELRERGHLLDCCVIWEPPRRVGQRRYVIGVDVSDGLGLGPDDPKHDRSVIQVMRAGTIEQPAEQVAEYVTNTVAPVDLAYRVQALGDYYRDADGVEALVAIENNNHGLSTQDTLQLHLGYTHFYRWEYYDAADPSARYSTKIGWVTNARTRPILLDKFRTALTTRDEVTGLPDLVTHSALLHNELQDFQTDGALWEAEAARGAHDDALMAMAIAYYVGWRLQGGETAPLEDRRRRRSEQSARLLAAAQPGPKPDWRNTPSTTAEVEKYGGSHTDEDGDLDEQLYDPRATDSGGDW